MARATPRHPPVVEPDRPPRHAWRDLGLGALFIVSLCAVLYANALANPFHMDDHTIIVNNPRVRDFRTTELLTGNYWHLGDTDPLYRPLVMLSYAANWAISQQAWAFRLPNLIAHAGVCVLLLALTRRIFRSYRVALVTAAFFAVHPLHTESLNTIVGRADMLVALFMIGGLLAFMADQTAERRRLPILPAAGTLLYAAALLCKENAVTFVGLVLLLDWWWARRPDGAARGDAARRIRRCYAPIVVVTAGYLILRVSLLGGLTSPAGTIDRFDNPIAHPADGLSAGDSAILARWATPLVTLTKALGLTVLPDRLCFDYSYAAIEPVTRVSDPRLWVGLSLLVFLAVATVVALRRRSPAGIALAIAAISYSIVSNFVVVIGTIFAERLLYLPIVGFAMLVGLAVDAALRYQAARRSARSRAVAITSCLLLALAGALYGSLTVRRNLDWRSDVALYGAAYEVNPRSCKVLAGMAAKALSDGNLPQALHYCDRSQEVAPTYWPAWRSAGFILRRLAAEAANPAEKQRLLDEALRRYQQALDLGAAADPEAMMGAARLYAQRGGYQRAIAILEQLLVHRPFEATAHHLLARYLLLADPPARRDPQRALDSVQRAIALRPEIANYIDTQADALLALGRRREAVDAIRRVLQTLPADSPGVAHFRQRLAQIEGE